MTTKKAKTARERKKTPSPTAPPDSSTTTRQPTKKRQKERVKERQPGKLEVRTVQTYSVRTEKAKTDTPYSSMTTCNLESQENQMREKLDVRTDSVTTKKEKTT